MLQVYTRLNHLNVAISYTGILSKVDTISEQHKAPVQKWIDEGSSFKFVGDNVDKKRGVRDIRSDHHGKMKHMYSLLAVRSRVKGPLRAPHFNPPDISREKVTTFLPSSSDVKAIKDNLVVLVSRILCTYIKGFKSQRTDHIAHRYSAEMSSKSSVIVCDVFHKQEIKRDHMIKIMQMTQDFVGKDYTHTVPSGRRHMADGDTPRERLELLEPVTEDWHALMNYLIVRLKNKLIINFTYVVFQNRVCGRISSRSAPRILAP